MKYFLFSAALILFSSVCFSQTCEVLVAALKGAYQGDCKKNKANGNGSAIGQDSYTGEFKNGYPDGKGRYSWKNGDWYEGEWKKGLREGKGTMFYKEENAKDSLLTGYWKKDKYIGKYEKPYTVYYKTPDIAALDISRENSRNFEIIFTMQSTRGGAMGINSQIPKLTISNVDVINGQYMTRADDNNMPKTTKTVLRGVQFPFRIRVTIAIGVGTTEGDIIEVEFLEEGRYNVDIHINK